MSAVLGKKQSTWSQLGQSLAVIAIGYPWMAFVLNLAWTWFVAPWLNVLAPSVLQMTGMLLVYRWLTMAFIARPKPDMPFFHEVSEVMMKPAVLLILLFVVRLCALFTS
jgi:hypothetical protein